MPNSATFLAKVAEKPKWMSAQEQAKTFAGPGGWYMKNGNPAAAPELIETIPGLSNIIDFDSAGNLVADVGTIKTKPATLVRRSRRGFNVVIGLEEQFKNDKVNNVQFVLALASGAATTTDGNPMPNFSPGGGSIVYELAAGDTTGRLLFQLPLLDEAPATLTLTFPAPAMLVVEATVGPIGVQTPTAITGLTGFVDSENRALDTLDLNGVYGPNDTISL